MAINSFIKTPQSGCNRTQQKVDVYYGGGVDGKSAYQTAVEGGYTGTEEEFEQLLANMRYMEDIGPESSATGFVQV